MQQTVINKGKLNKVHYILIAMQVLLSIAFIVMVINFNIMPIKYIVIIGIFLIVEAAINIFILKWKIGRIISGILSAIIIIVLSVGGYYLYKTSNMLDRITSIDTEKYNVNIYVKADDNAKTINDVEDYTFGILSELDKESTNETIEKINEVLEASISTKEYNSITELMDALLNGDVGAIILNEGYISALEDLEEYEDVSSRIKAIYINEIEKEVVEETDESSQDDESITEKSFIVYISGIDTNGPVSTRSRSDVNILMVVNPVDKKILLVNTPRDYYIPLSISKGVRDKLTHAGNYGINVSMNTLEMLYNIDIDYYLRLNFTGFVNIIDALGGINVYSDYDFFSENDHFVKGFNYLNGKRALTFARTRYAFASGDRQRGRNQMSVIQAVINKLTSKAILNNYTALLNSIGSSMQTNMSMDEIGELVKMQLNDMSRWDVSTFSVDGTGQYSYTYSIPSMKAYVMVPDESTVNEAKGKINQAMGN